MLMCCQHLKLQTLSTCWIFSASRTVIFLWESTPRRMFLSSCITSRSSSNVHSCPCHVCVYRHIYVCICICMYVCITSSSSPNGHSCPCQCVYTNMHVYISLEAKALHAKHTRPEVQLHAKPCLNPNTLGALPLPLSLSLSLSLPHAAAIQQEEG